ncbi:MAG TPA: lysylphosphatidylglycerol synthase domain-containing protein, partial [Planctomycetaceae bacterium]|nr:lysylphosphatidylglycerol synthase domain-containing protein [Planctomycetaceae bacterium]
MSAEQGSFFRRMMHQLSPLISVLLFAVALYVLHRALSGHHYSEIIAQLEELPRRNVVWAGALSVLSYFALTSYEVLALLYVRRPLSYPRIAFASFIGYTFSNNLGFSLISGAPIRFRLYSGWGLSALEIANIVAFTGLTFAIGFIGVAGFTFLVEPVAIPESLHIPLVHSVQPLGVLFVVIALGYVALNLIGRQQFQIREWEIRLPGWKMALLQFVVSALDWAVAGGVLWALFPPTAPLSYGELMGVFMLAQTAGLVSNVPGGLGVFETVMLVTLQ